MYQPSVADRMAAARSRLPALASVSAVGHVDAASGLGVTITGLGPLLGLGDRLVLRSRDTAPIPAEIVGFRAGAAQAMPLGALTGIGPGTRAVLQINAGAALPNHTGRACLAPADSWLGRVIDPLGRPLDGRGSLPTGTPRPVRASPPPAAHRNRLGARISLGVRTLDLFTTCRQGQRLGQEADANDVDAGVVVLEVGRQRKPEQGVMVGIHHLLQRLVALAVHLPEVVDQALHLGGGGGVKTQRARAVDLVWRGSIRAHGVAPMSSSAWTNSIGRKGFAR